MNTHKSNKFHATTETKGSVCTVFLRGELDLSVASDFRLVMEPLVGDPKLDLVINLKELKYIDSTGIGILLAILKARQGMDVRFIVEEVPSQIQKLFDMTGITKFLPPKRIPTRKGSNKEMSDDVQKVILQLPATAEYVDIVRLNLYGIASKMGFTYEDIEDMKVAVSEACNNSVLYAYGQQDGVVEVIFEVGANALSITVKDEGESFGGMDTSRERMALHDKELSDAQVGGLGFYLMQALMDDVNVVSEAGRGTVVTLIKRLNFSEEKV